MTTTFESRILPGMCDMNGHLNVAFYAQFFDGACWAFLELLGGVVHAGATGWADVQHTTRFLKEVSAGSRVNIRSQVSKVGQSSVVTEHHLFADDEAEPSATIEIATVRFDLENRTAIPLEPALRTALEDRLDANETPD